MTLILKTFYFARRSVNSLEDYLHRDKAVECFQVLLYFDLITLFISCNYVILSTP